MKHSLQIQAISTQNRAKRLHFDRMHALSLAFYVKRKQSRAKVQKNKGKFIKKKRNRIFKSGFF